MNASMTIRRDEVQAEVDAMLWSADLAMVRRYYEMTYWEAEAQEERLAEASRNGPRLESVADHSWHLTDSLTLVHPHFPNLDLTRCLYMAILHDKLEVLTGDAAPMGQSGTGYDGTAFNRNKIAEKERRERLAMQAYLSMLPKSVAENHRAILAEYMDCETEEARFVHAMDKLQVYTWLIRKKRGHMTDAHVAFSVKYVRAKVHVFPGLEPYAQEFEERLLDAVAMARGVTRAQVEEAIGLQDLRTSG